ncbi:MAG: hypothetical protein ABIO35_08345 [Nitrobacter sp.]
MIEMTFDPTVSFGAMLQAAALLIGFIFAFSRLGNRIDLLSQRLAAVEETLKSSRDVGQRIAIIETRQATHGQMIAALQRDISEVKHGRGFIISPREYPEDEQ